MSTVLSLPFSKDFLLNVMIPENWEMKNLPVIDFFCCIGRIAKGHFLCVCMIRKSQIIFKIFFETDIFITESPGQKK